MEQKKKGQIKSKERVAEHGEVFTSEREVSAMLDLVKHETERLDSRFLEPACGDGNFLAEILRRKLLIARNVSKGNKHDYEKNALIALSSIYGVELMQDNAAECRARLFEIWDKEYTSVMKKDASDGAKAVAKFFLNRNILCGNALTLKRVDADAKDLETPIVFSEWSCVTGDIFKRRDFQLDQLMAAAGQMDLAFMADWDYDNELEAYIPKPIKEYAPKEYWRLPEDGE